MFAQEKPLTLIQEILEEQQNSETEPDYLKSLFYDHSHLIVDYDHLEFL